MSQSAMDRNSHFASVGPRTFWSFVAGALVLGAVMGALGVIVYDRVQEADRAARALARKKNEEAAQECFNNANHFRELKNLDWAIDNYKKAIELDPGNATYHLALAGTYWDAARTAEAAAAYQKVVELNPLNAEAQLSLGRALQAQSKQEQAMAVFEKAGEANDARVRKLANFYWGNLLREKGQADRACAAYQKAIEADPGFIAAYNNLAGCYRDQQQFDKALEACRKAIAVDPSRSGPAHDMLGDIFRAAGRSGDAVVAYQKAIALEPNSPFELNKLGRSLQEVKRNTEAVATFRKAIELAPKFAWAYCNLGATLYDMKNQDRKNVDRAIEALKTSIDLDPTFGQAYLNLGAVYHWQGAFAEAEKTWKKLLDSLPKDHPLRGQAEEQLKWTQRLQALEKRLPLPADNKEDPLDVLNLALVYGDGNQRHAAAVQLFQAAFKTRPDAANDLDKQYRYTAACSATHAALGEGDAAKRKQEEKVQLRCQGLDWLRADLDLYSKYAKEGPENGLIKAVMFLSYWQQDPLLAGVRDDQELKKLPEEEANRWRKLWTDVDRTLKEAEGRFAESRIEGTLTAQEKTRAHDVKMRVGKLYIVEMESKVFNTLLLLQDSQGNVLRENDDISYFNQNSRIIFNVPADGSYQLIASSPLEKGVGRLYDPPSGLPMKGRFVMQRIATLVGATAVLLGLTFISSGCGANKKPAEVEDKKPVAAEDKKPAEPEAARNDQAPKANKASDAPAIPLKFDRESQGVMAGKEISFQVLEGVVTGVTSSEPKLTARNIGNAIHVIAANDAPIGPFEIAVRGAGNMQATLKVTVAGKQLTFDSTARDVKRGGQATFNTEGKIEGYELAKNASWLNAMSYEHSITFHIGPDAPLGEVEISVRGPADYLPAKLKVKVIE